MELWNKARSFAEETAKRTQELTKEAAKRSQDLSIGATKFSDVVAEATKRSKEIAAQASKRADQMRIEAIKRADEIKIFADGINAPGRIAILEPYVGSGIQEKDLQSFGITDELSEFVQGITLTTFQHFPLQGIFVMCTVSELVSYNVEENLNESPKLVIIGLLRRLKLLQVNKLMHQIKFPLGVMSLSG